jgi:sporulation protein YlmC with PRC-barrel domain
MDMPLNVDVYCTDGVCGRSKEVIMDRETDEVTHLVVKVKDSASAEILVPVDLVTKTTPHEIQLRWAKDELAELQPFLKTEIIEDRVPRFIVAPYLMRIEAPETGWIAVEREDIPPGELAVRQGARVEATDGRVGKLDEFLVDPANERVSHLVMREGHLWGRRDVTIPVSQIDRLEENAIYLKLNKKQVEALPSTPTAMR